MSQDFSNLQTQAHVHNRNESFSTGQILPVLEFGSPIHHGVKDFNELIETGGVVVNDAESDTILNKTSEFEKNGYDEN